MYGNPLAPVKMLSSEVVSAGQAVHRGYSRSSELQLYSQYTLEQFMAVKENLTVTLLRAADSITL